MKLGVVFPQTEIGTDPVVIRDFAQAVEQLGYDHLMIYDHVLGANPAARPGWKGFFTHKDMFHEPFVLFAYLAAHTERLGLVTGIVILPQRQTALVAKQAAEVDVLSGGRLRFGVGVGWNEVEYVALGKDFHTRGVQMAEQVRVLRALWTQESVTFRGRWHQIEDAGINPLPVQRPIPIWMGGTADVVLRRIARLADGWFPSTGPAVEAQRALLTRLREYIRARGRGQGEVGLEPRVSVAQGGPEEWRRQADEWRELGATHLSVSTPRTGLTPDAHIQMVTRFKEALQP